MVKLVACLIVLAMIGGWIANIVKMIGSLDQEVTALFIVRCIGIVAVPFGAIMGFI